MIFTNARIENAQQLQSIRVENGVFTEIGRGGLRPRSEAGAASVCGIARASGHLSDGRRSGVEYVRHSF